MTDYLWIHLGTGILAVLGLALVLRLASLPLLLRVQRSVRQRALAARGVAAASAWPWAAVCGELVVELGGAVGLALLLNTDYVDGFDLLKLSIATGRPLHLAAELHITQPEAQTRFHLAAISALVVWLLLWFLTQRRLLTAATPAGTWASPPVAGRLAGLFALRLALGVFAPVGLVVAGLVFQVVALVAALRFRSADGATTAPPLPSEQPGSSAQPGSFGPSGPSGSFGPPLPYVPPMPSAPPARPVAHVPTQVDRGAGAVPQVTYQQLHPNEPRTIGGYQLLGRIGSGGMGTVYLARREGAATQVALKTINPELLDHEELLHRFEREAEVLAMVSGAYTARVLDAGLDAGRPYLAMELLDGRPLDVHLRERGRSARPRRCAPWRWHWRSRSPGCTGSAWSTVTSNPPTSC